MAGPDTLALKVTYEIGLSGLVSLQRALKKGAGDDRKRTLVYADHSRFLEGEDEEIGAHFGIRYKIQENKKGN